MTEQDPRAEQPRHNIDQMRREIADGGNIYTVVGSVLQTEAQTLFAFRGGRLSNLPFGSSGLGLRDLPGATKDQFSHLFSPNDLGCVSGFSYVARRMYPLVARASEHIGELSPLPESIEAIMSESEKVRKLFAAEVATHPQLRGLVSGELEDSLREDPSGVTWLEKSVEEEFKDAGGELIGAKRAVAATGTLYKLLSTK